MITIKNLYKSFNSFEALSDINLDIHEGEIFGIVGHSGAGKSTLLRCINGLEDFDSGNLVVMNNKIKNLNHKDLRYLRKNIGMVFQSDNLLPSRNVFDNIALPLKSWGYDNKHIEKKVVELATLVELGDKLYSMPSELSGGQKQRVSIARALTLEPKLLLCDEATSALDPKITQSILQLLNKINKNLGITIITVTHQMEVIKQLCNRVALMDGGRIVALGEVDKLFLSNNKEVQNLLGEHEILPSKGVNFKIYYRSGNIYDAVITEAAKTLNINLSVVWGKLEQFRDHVCGSLIVNVDAENKDLLSVFLKNCHMDFEIIEKEERAC